MNIEATTDEVRQRIRAALESEANYEGTVIFNDEDDLDEMVERVLASIQRPMLARR